MDLTGVQKAEVPAMASDREAVGVDDPGIEVEDGVFEGRIGELKVGPSDRTDAPPWTPATPGASSEDHDATETGTFRRL